MYIFLKAIQKGNMVCIRIENYCENFPKLLSDGLPETSKGDSNFHGYGTRSMRYTVEKYDGNFTISQEGKLFVVNVLLPAKLNRE